MKRRTAYQIFLDRIDKEKKESAAEKRQKIKQLRKISALFIACGRLWKIQAKKLE
jgi:hypothetical protein